MNRIKIHIDNIPKTSNSPILGYCRYLIDEGVDPQMSLEVVGPSLQDKTQEILYMRVNVGNGAKLTVKEETSDGKPRFAKYRLKERWHPHPAFIFPRGELHG